MEYFAVIKNDECQTVRIWQQDVETLKKSHRKRWYVIDDTGRVQGYIGTKEYTESVRQNKIVMNQQFIYLYNDADNKEKAEEIFRNNKSIPTIPVVSYDNRLLYEYVRDNETFYDELKIECGVNKKDEREKKIIISLTTHGKRLDTVYLTIKSVMYQTCKADNIILFLDSDDSNRKIMYEDELVETGLTIIRNVQNLGPHTKYYQAMIDFKDSIIVTVDDDVLYDDALIEELYERHLKFPDAVICRYGKRIKKNENVIEKYELWEDKVIVDEPQIDVCPLGVGGCLYPCGGYREKFLDMKGIVSCCIGNDDLWLKAIEMINGIKTVSIGSPSIHLIRNTQDSALWVENCNRKKNDKYIMDIQRYLKINLSEYF